MVQTSKDGKDKCLGNIPKTLIKSRNNMLHVAFIEIENTSSNW